jgi:hypothetical protein
MFWSHIGLLERQTASRIIADLRRDFTARQVAKMFEFPRIYISFAQNLNKRNNGNYICPAWAIEKIIQNGALMGARRTVASPSAYQEPLLTEKTTPRI